MKNALCLLVLGLLAGAAPAAERLNVLLIISDDLRDTVGCYGNPAVKTPNLDRLAARGVRFNRAYAQYPVCNPSRTSFMTGLRCEQTGVVGNTTMFRTRLPDIVTMPQLLRQHGWYAASYGKIYHVGEAAGEVRDGWMDVGKSWDEAKMFQPTPAGRKGDVRNLTGGQLKWCEVGAMEGTDDDQPDGQNALDVIAAIEQQTAAGKPWCIGVGFHRPHDPFLVPKKYFDLYPAGSLKLCHDPADITPVPPLSMPGGGFKTAFDAFTDPDRLDFLRGYYAGVSFTDAQVGRLMDTLDRLKLWNQTLVIFAGDNGPEDYRIGNAANAGVGSPGPLRARKRSMYEGGIRTFGLVRWPGHVAADRVDETSVLSGVDWLPTICKLAGVTVPDSIQADGEDVSDIWLGQPRARRKPLYWEWLFRGWGDEYTPPMLAICDGPWKLFVNHDGQLTLEEFVQNFPDQAEGRRRFPTFDTNKDGVLSDEEFVPRGASRNPNP